jgi:hypothetical protein
MSTIKITNTEFVRDMESQAVLNTDVSGLQQFELTRKRLKSERAERSETKERLKQLEQSMTELKLMIAELITLKGSHGNH